MLPQEEIYKAIKNYFVTRDRIHRDEKLNIRKWKIINYQKIPQQVVGDSVNCGIYLIYYISKLAKLKDVEDIVNSDFDPESYRIIIQNVLLLNSKAMYHKCLYCGKATQETYIQCNVCHRWIHFKVCSQLEGSENLATIQDPNFTFHCKLCTCLQYKLFQSREQETNISLPEIELEYFVLHYKTYLESVYTNKQNSEANRYRITDNPEKHLKWDYCTAFISLKDAITICKIIVKETGITDISFVCYVLFGLISKKIIYKFYGLEENGGIDLTEKYKELHEVNDFNFDFPISYTLDQIHAKLTEY